MTQPLTVKEIVLKTSITVFISSTVVDLERVRATVSAFIEEIGLTPLQMERFEPGYVSSWEKIQNAIHTCDFFLLIVGDRYGSESDEGISYTEMEFNLASELGKRILVFTKKINEEDEPKLVAFKRRVWKRNVEAWQSPEDLNEKLPRRTARWIIHALRQAAEDEGVHREVYAFLLNRLTPLPDIELTREFLQYLGGKELSGIEDVLDALESLLKNFVDARIQSDTRAYLAYRLMPPTRTTTPSGEPIEALYRIGYSTSGNPDWPEGLLISKNSNVHLVYRTKRVQRVGNATTNAPAKDTPNQRVTGEGSVIAAPIIIDDICIGVIGISSPRVGEAVTPQYRRLASEVQVIFSALFYAYAYGPKSFRRSMSGRMLRNEIARYFERQLPRITPSGGPA